MSQLDEQTIDVKSFAYRDLIGQDRWEDFTVSTNATVVGTLSSEGRYRVQGRSCQFQASFVATTTFASTAGSTFMALPIEAAGIAGLAAMMNETTNVAVGLCSISVSSSRCYFPTQNASSDAFRVAGWYEI